MYGNKRVSIRMKTLIILIVNNVSERFPVSTETSCVTL